MLPFPRPWNRQPDSPVGVNRENPLTRGLISLCAVSTGIDVVRNRLLQDAVTSSGGSYKGLGKAIQTPAGVVKTSTQSNAYLWATKPDIDPEGWGPFQRTNATTLLAVFIYPAGTWATNRLVGYSVNGYALGTRYSNQVPYCSWGTVNLEGTPSISDGKPHVVCLTWDETTARAYLDGAQYASGAAAAPTYTGFAGYDGFLISDKTLMWAEWNRALTAAEIAQVSADVWQLFAPELVYLNLAISGGVTANGATLTADFAIIAGSASGQIAATAPGTTFTMDLAEIAGSASGAIVGNASGTTFTETFEIIAGAASASGAGTAAGFTFTETFALTAGSAVGNQVGNAAGTMLTMTMALTPGTANGGGGGSGTSYPPVAFYLGGGMAIGTHGEPIVVLF